MSVSIKSPTSTTGSIQLNGSDVLTIDSSGNLTAPNNLTVTGTVTQTGGATFNGGISGNVAFDTDTLYVDATNNRVGIGTSSPQRQLHIHEPSSEGSFIHLTNDTTGSTGNDGFDILLGSDENGYLNMRESNNLIFKTGDTERMRIASSGYVFIGGTATTDDDHFRVEPNGVPTIRRASGNGRSGIAFFNSSTNCGNIILNTSSTQYNTSSDYRLKENVTPMSDSINRLKQLKPSTWTWVNGGNGEGFIAHEAQTVVPEAISGTKDEVDDEGNPVYQGIDQSKLVPLLTAALQEAITKIEDLETRIATLENPNG